VALFCLRKEVVEAESERRLEDEDEDVDVAAPLPKEFEKSFLGVSGLGLVSKSVEAGIIFFRRPDGVS